MVVENNEKERASEREQAHERISIRMNEAADAIRDLIRSVSIGVEERIAIQDQIDNISKETESMFDRIDSIAKKSQRNLLLAYKNFGKHNLEAIDQRLKELE